MTSHEKLVWTGIVVEAICILYYLYTTWKGETRPQPITWGGWTVIGVVATWVSYNEGSGQAVYINAAFVVGTLAIFGSSIIQRYKLRKEEADEPNPTDLPVLALGCLLIACWALKLGPAPAYITAAVIGDSCFAWFTFRHAKNKPSEENLIAWIGGVAAAAIGVAVLGNYSYSAAAYTIYILAANAFITGTLVVKRLKWA